MGSAARVFPADTRTRERPMPSLAFEIAPRNISYNANIRGAAMHAAPIGRGGRDARSHFQPKSWIIAGPMMTAKSTGRKKTIIGTVSLGGRAAAFFSASAMRASRLSWERTRIA